MKHHLIPEKPFTRDNWEATDEQIDKANTAFQIASTTWFDGLDLDDDQFVDQQVKTLIDRVGNAFNDGLSAGDIAHWATSK